MEKYNLSIILPYYKKYDEFIYALENNKNQFEKVNEVIIIFDEIIDISKFSFLKNYNINFKCFTNTENHEWRNPAVVLNFGIKNAISEYCLIMSPESLLLNNAINELMNNANENEFSVGKVVFLKENIYKNYNNKNDFEKIFELTETKNNNYIGPVFYGSICCKKTNFEKVNYYTEEFNESGWGGEDDDVRNKLIKNNIKMNKINAKIIHLENELSFNKRLYKQINIFTKKYNSKFDNFIKIDYKEIDKNILESELKKNNSIIKYELKDKIYEYYPIILITQCFNEKKYINDFFENTQKFVDGYIVLDDESTDNSWELLKSDKLLLKAMKKRTTFNDLENRNLLLNLFENVFIKNNIIVDWFIWLDFDERINENENIIKYLRNILLSKSFKPNILNIPFVHMWNEIEYNGEYPSSKDGIQNHIRIIRNVKEKMPYIIKNEKNLHFQLNPYEDKIEIFPLLIKHLGRNNEELRKNKYKLYTESYDKNLESQKNYDHFLNDNIKLFKYNNVKNSYIYNFFNTMQPVILYGGNCEDNKNMAYEHSKYISNIIPGSCILEINNKIFNFLDSERNLVLLIFYGNIYDEIKIKIELDKKNINYIGTKSFSSCLCVNKFSSNKLIDNNTFKDAYLANINNKEKKYKQEINNFINKINKPNLLIKNKNFKKYSIAFFNNILIGIIEYDNNNNIKIPVIEYNLLNNIINESIKLQNELNCEDYILLDFLLDSENEKYHFTKISSSIIFCKNSAFFVCGMISGYNFESLIKNILKIKYNKLNKRLIL